MPTKQLYLDDAATTRVSEKVLAAMKPLYTEHYANPSSQHAMGEKAAEALQKARKTLAKEINARPEEIIFTSGSTESNNLALKGTIDTKKNNIIISAIEHPAIREVAHNIPGKTVIEIPVDAQGLVDMKALDKTITTKTLIVSIMHVNNVIGSVQDLKTIGHICHKKKTLFHTDATQSFGKLPIDVKTMNIDLLSASAHKLGGPKGVGLLYVRNGISLRPLLHGGGQERGMRSGTENVPSIVGFATALQLQKKINRKKITALRKKLIHDLTLLGATIISPQKGMPEIITTSFPTIDAETLLYRLSHKGIHVSAGSACDSKKQHSEEHVLTAIDIGKKERNNSIRITLTSTTTTTDLHRLFKELKNLLDN